MTFAPAIVQVEVGGGHTLMVLVYVPEQDRRAAAVAAALTLVASNDRHKRGEE